MLTFPELYGDVYAAFPANFGFKLFRYFLDSEKRWDSQTQLRRKLQLP